MAGVGTSHALWTAAARAAASVHNASFFGVLQVIELPDESHLVRGTANGGLIMGVGA